jgi:demethoxyubiquinone hydroxylase (CLK1/Coq7/Cat5 family)
MMARIQRVRSVEYVMTDAIDQKFRELYEEVDSVYEVWRKYRRWYANFRIEEAQRNELAQSDAESGSYEALRQLYDNYRMDRLAAQEQDKWAVGFNNEMEPIIEKMEERIAEMNGWVEEGYADWTRILGELFEIESSLE